jgi:hypothetical protein
LNPTIKPREREALIQSLRAGVVPRFGQHLIQVGRRREIETMKKTVETISAGGTSFRLVIGEYGSGKSFFIGLVKNIALEKKLVTVNADLSPTRRLLSSGGQARSLFSELMKNMATKTKPDGEAIASIVEKFVASTINEAEQRGIVADRVIGEKLLPLEEMFNGYDFTAVIKAYHRGYETGNDELKQSAIRWLRGEFSTKSEANHLLGVRNIINDNNIYDQLKLMSRFVTIAGYSGLYVFLDEMVNLYKIHNTTARNGNYEQILRILNDVLQGNVCGIGFLLAGTPEFLTDTRRGLYSYEALQSRLAENPYVHGNTVDFSGPIIRLENLTPEEFYLLIKNIRHVYAFGDPATYMIPDEALVAFMKLSSTRLGNDYFRTPRTTIISFINFLSILEQNPSERWENILNVGDLDFKKDVNSDTTALQNSNDDEFADFVF